MLTFADLLDSRRISAIKSETANEVILVSKNYLGSINHTLLTYEMLKQRGIPMAGIVFNGPENPSGEKFILNHTGLPLVLRVNTENELNEAVIASYAHKIHV